MLTGWTWIGLSEPNRGGEFLFVKRLHEPGEQTVIGKALSRYRGRAGPCRSRRSRAHPTTAQHIAHKLARHFVADAPPQALVDKLAKSFNDTDGNLKELAKTLVSADEAWTTERSKLKRPSELVVAMLRLTGAQWAIARVMGGQTLLGEPLWRPPAPNGYADHQSAWIDGLSNRLDVANEFAGRMAGMDPLMLLDEGLSPLASLETRNTIARAESRQQALALLLMAPEFLRR